MAKQARINISAYLSQNFSNSFLTIFLPLFFIGALVFIIKISSLTASIQINFWEMIQLFGYNLPLILFYTIPISFLVAIVITLLRLSNENELMALFALGTKSKSIIYRLFFISLLFSMILLILSLGLIPKTKQQFKSFKQEKSTQAQVNINPSKLGQKFGNLFVYVESKTDNKLNNIVIFNKDKEHNNQLFIAKHAHIQNKNALITLTLEDGSGYTFDEKVIKEINYEEMQVYQSLHSDEFTYNNIIDYWTALSLGSRKGRILFFIYISLIPIMGLLSISAFSIINPRYQKNYAYIVVAVVAIALYGTAMALENSGTFLLLLLAIIMPIIIGLLLFRHNVSRYF